MKHIKYKEEMDMSDSQIDDVDIVADTCAVGSVIIISVDVYERQPAGCDLCDIGQEIVRYALRIFSDQAAFMRADRVEIAKQHDVPGIVALPDIREDAFLHRLGCSVRIGCFAQGAFFGNRYESRVPVNRSGRGKDEFFNVVSTHVGDVRNGRNPGAGIGGRTMDCRLDQGTDQGSAG